MAKKTKKTKVAKKRSKKVRVKRFQGDGSDFVKGAKKKQIEKRLDEADKVAKRRVAKKVESKKHAVDKFGARVGTNRAKIHAAIGKKPQTMKQLRDKAGVSYSMGEHLNLLVDAKLIKKSDEGYYI